MSSATSFGAFFLFLFFVFAAEAQELKVFGYNGGDRPALLTDVDVNAIRTETLGGISTWLALATKLNTSQPEFHLIDTEYFKRFPTTYGLHQAYAQKMGFVTGGRDFIRKMKGANGEARSIMPLTLYIPRGPIEMTRDGKTFSAGWVLQNRRYRFVDSTGSFTRSMIDIQQLVRSSFSWVNGRPLFVTYKKSGFHRPNLSTQTGRRDIRAFANQGFGVITTRELARKAGKVPSPVMVHNAVEENQAFGFLKIVSDESDLESLTPQSIAIFKNLPDRIPPVSAILTLEEQTPFSHINILAVNRGTLNIAVDQEATSLVASILATANSGVDRPFRIQVKDGQVNLSQASDEEVARYYQQQRARVGAVKIPEMDQSLPIAVIKPHQQHGTQQIGAKAANYGKLERLFQGTGLVRPGFAIGFSLYNSIVGSGSDEASIQSRLITPLVEKVRGGLLTPVQVNAELEKIRSEISQAALPESLVDSLVHLVTVGAYKTEKKIRFRSSTNCEDLPRFNGAGLYLSEGIKTKHIRKAKTDVVALNKVRKDLLLVVGSLWLPRAFWEREYFSIDHLKAGMAIQINPSFSNEFANGVIIASSKGEKTEFRINSQLGEASVTNPGPAEVPESLKVISDAVGVDQFQRDLERNSVQLEGRSNIGPVFFGPESSLLLETKAPLAQLLWATRRTMENLISDPKQFGIDIEFKLMKEDGDEIKLFIKQARPLNLQLSH